MITNWKTTAAGIAALGTGLTVLGNAVVTGDYSNVGTGLTALFSGFVGLLAKDFNVTGTAK